MWQPALTAFEGENGAPLLQSFRNEDYVYGQVRADYALSPALAVYAVVQYNDRLYVHRPLPGSFRPNSSGYEADVGADGIMRELTQTTGSL